MPPLYNHTRGLAYRYQGSMATVVEPYTRSYSLQTSMKVWLLLLNRIRGPANGINDLMATVI